jgi:hypothetical protein
VVDVGLLLEEVVDRVSEDLVVDTVETCDTEPWLVADDLDAVDFVEEREVPSMDEDRVENVEGSAHAGAVLSARFQGCG